MRQWMLLARNSVAGEDNWAGQLIGPNGLEALASFIQMTGKDEAASVFLVVLDRQHDSPILAVWWDHQRTPIAQDAWPQLATMVADLCTHERVALNHGWTWPMNWTLAFQDYHQWLYDKTTGELAARVSQAKAPPTDAGPEPEWKRIMKERGTS